MFVMVEIEQKELLGPQLAIQVQLLMLARIFVPADPTTDFVAESVLKLIVLAKERLVMDVQDAAYMILLVEWLDGMVITV